ncbi:S26 family signal peptidase [Micromonosporaceae bacterium DT55]|uniref:S26 family signal peptidase n=1 Tax=Melissospora conviva TaxID=3388432 RepID=UPI003C16EAA8
MARRATEPELLRAAPFAAVTVPADSVFVMGDSRARSNDSRGAGPVPVSSVFAAMVD